VAVVRGRREEQAVLDGVPQVRPIEPGLVRSGQATRRRGAGAIIPQSYCRGVDANCAL
jgi:hypothetical protein